MIDSRSRTPKLDTPTVVVVRAHGPARDYGVETRNVEGIPVAVTSPAKTVADCFRYRRHVGLDAHGTLVYRGAIDNSPDGEGESPAGDKLVNYVADAIEAIAGGRPVATSETQAYGCGVNY